ncbi:MAG: hypothetical protein V3V08_14235 [Nannocystaceae bacterium]
MEAHVEHAYVSEIVNQCEGAIAAVERMNTALASKERAVVFFQHAQAFILHAGAVSRVFWPPRIRNAARWKTARSRGEHFRHQFGISSPHILEDRSLRNHIEHFDERLDEWASSLTSRGILVDLNLMPLAAIGGISPKNIFRQYDPQAKIFYFQGKAFDIQPMAAAISEVLKLAVNRLALIRSPSR